MRARSDTRRRRYSKFRPQLRSAIAIQRAKISRELSNSQTSNAKAVPANVAQPGKERTVTETLWPTKSYAVYGLPADFPSSPTLNFSERLTVCRALNPLSRGLMNPPDTYTNDFFYREILPVGARSTDYKTNAASFPDNDVDVCGQDVGEALRAESLVSSPAEECAADVLSVLRLQTVDEEGDSAVPHIWLREKADREPADVGEHLAAFLRFIFVQRLTDLSTLNTPAGASMFYSMSMTNANRLRESLRLYNKKSLLAMIKAHAWLLGNLPAELLAAYLNLLRFLKVAGSNLSRHVIDQSDAADIQAANLIIGQFLVVKMYDPPTNSIGKLMSGVEPLKNVCLLLVYPQVRLQESNAQLVRPYESLFKNLLPRVVQVAEKIDFRLESRVSDNVEDCARSYVQLIVKHVRDIVKRRPNDHVFLAGWGISCLLNHRAVALVPGVSGILDYAFPTNSAIGPRGDVNDEICLTTCPSLFVIGENASDTNLSNLQGLRGNMQEVSGLILIGDANKNLIVSSARLTAERASQRMVDLAVTLHTREFIEKSVFFQSLLPRRLSLPSIHSLALHIDVELLRNPEQLVSFMN